MTAEAPRTVEQYLARLRESLQGADPALVQPDDRASGLLGVDLIAQPIDGMSRQPGPQNTVERARRSALLGLPEHHLAGVEESLAFLLEQPAQEVTGVHRTGLLVHHGQEQPLPDPEAVHHLLHVMGQVLEGDALLVQVDPDGTAGEPASTCNSLLSRAMIVCGVPAGTSRP